MKLLLIPVFISLLDAASAAKLQITLPQSLSVREGENVTLPCSFYPPSPDLSHIVLEWFTMPRRYTENVTRREMTKIYQSGYEKEDLSIVKSVGDVRMGNCSIGIPNFPSSLGPVALCIIKCHRCNAENIEVREEMVLNVMPADPQLHSGASGMSVAAAEETSPTAGPHFRGRKGLVAAVVVVAAAVVIIFIQKRRRSSGTSPGSHSGDGQADVHGGVEENWRPLMEVNGHKGDNGDNGTDGV
ncbi:uncharacterized protein LOC133339591 [Lethenteron reissneri]|uniref:uncharacterized protein LOC133339586 n=1 Tax=Lethenteron reissneri TaxID=7753 RepID=UPI002AB7C1AB|nr:uncharacterized protein LOC133339586 [Lethenteron reissneri]XP_061403683.1 uncharacterized protein LOC133339586 [Lethenteron reissneri]XP_061403684.1 uncharacterized protein LOC133339586 [Lethenteron reissneri]XP_061403685.1 uncharacterized protein LOC133339586 [Lethenteron reissneri]XP_061403693.1 uncharacterized protein LOC133339591 [Lethenteron reissneri]XP_061403694.1 uncharacterized protein LOC133339591 [Lethenteron reissneri]XP_061403696.1 uncharacterized protein LOC133339591 [Lethen